MNKYAYHVFFSYVKDFVKMSYFLDKLGIKRSNFSNFMKYNDYGAISEENLSTLYFEIMLEFNKVITFQYEKNNLG